jgi:hypothetical protein
MDTDYIFENLGFSDDFIRCIDAADNFLDQINIQQNSDYDSYEADYYQNSNDSCSEYVICNQ